MVKTITGAAAYPWSVEPTPELGELNDVSQVAAFLRCGRTTVFHLLGAGHLRSVKVGRRRAITGESVRAYVAALAGGQ